MVKRTIKPAVAGAHVTAAAAKSAARFVYRDSRTGKFVVSKRQLSAHMVRERLSSGSKKTARAGREGVVSTPKPAPSKRR